MIDLRARPRTVLAAAIAAVLAAALACSQRAPFPEPRFVLLYATCSLNKDFLGPYGDAVGYTPALSRLARGGLVFQKHHTEAGQSGVAFASLFTGAQAPHHGVYAHPTPLPPEVLLITEAYADAGYDVHSWLAQGMADAKLSYAQGVLPANIHGGLLRGEDPDFAAILDRLESDPDYRAFVIVNFTVTHGPYAQQWTGRFCAENPGECAARADREEFEELAALYRVHNAELSWNFERSVATLGLSESRIARLRAVIELLYESNVERLDRLFGSIVSQLRARALLEESLISFTSDHGEIHFRENAHFHWTHGYQLAPEVLNVAWILYGPSVGVRPGAYAGVSRSIDVFPTLAGLSGIALPEFPGRGVDLSLEVRGVEPPPDLRAFSHTALFSFISWEYFRHFEKVSEFYPKLEPEMMWVAVREGDEFHKLIRMPGDRWERAVFDLASDPGERTNLYDESSPRHRELGEVLREYKRSLVADLATRPDPMRVELGEREVEALKELGYAE